MSTTTTNILTSSSSNAPPPLLDLPPSEMVRPGVPSAVAAIQKLGAPPQTSPTLEEREIQKKSGGTWKCTEREFDPDSGGYSYIFELPDDYFDSSYQNTHFFRVFFNETSCLRFYEKNKELFPAVEVSPVSIFFLDPELTEKWDQWYSNHPYLTPYTLGQLRPFAPILQKLGFLGKITAEGFRLTLPDDVVLHHRWNQKLRAKFPELPELKLALFNGVASHSEFILAVLSSTALLSTGEEFVHDSITHIIPSLIMILDTQVVHEEQKVTFEYYQQKVEEVFKVAYDTLREQKQKAEQRMKQGEQLDVYAVFEAVLSAGMDGLTAVPGYNYRMTVLEEPLSKSLIGVMINDQWKNYFLNKANLPQKAIDSALRHFEMVSYGEAELFVLPDDPLLVLSH